MAFSLVFTGIGAWLFRKGWKRRSELKQVFRHGLRADGRVVDTEWTDYSVNGESPTRLHYEFEVDSRTYEGWIDSFEVSHSDATSGLEATVLYDPDDPSRNMLLV